MRISTSALALANSLPYMRRGTCSSRTNAAVVKKLQPSSHPHSHQAGRKYHLPANKARDCRIDAQAGGSRDGESREERRDGDGGAPSGLAGARLRLVLDIGREKNTWMPPAWAASGRRVEMPLGIELQKDGAAVPLGVASFINTKVSAGEWRVDGGTLRMWIETDGFTRGDVSLPPGKLYINVPVWGRVVSRTKGTLTVKQRRWIVRLESRLVGRLVAEVMPEGSDDLALGAVRVKQGDLDGPVYFNKQQ